MIDPEIFEKLQTKIDEETVVRDVSFSCLCCRMINVIRGITNSSLLYEYRNYTR